MAQHGTVGYIQDDKYYAYIQKSNEGLEDTFSDLFWIYMYLVRYGPVNFKKQIDKNPDGFIYTEWGLKSKELKGPHWEGENPDTELTHSFSPYGNLFYNFDNKTLNGKIKYGDTLHVKYISLPKSFKKLDYDFLFKNLIFNEIPYNQKALRHLWEDFITRKYAGWQKFVFLYLLFSFKDYLAE